MYPFAIEREWGGGFHLVSSTRWSGPQRFPPSACGAVGWDLLTCGPSLGPSGQRGGVHSRRLGILTPPTLLTPWHRYISGIPELLQAPLSPRARCLWCSVALRSLTPWHRYISGIPVILQAPMRPCARCLWCSVALLSRAFRLSALRGRDGPVVLHLFAHDDAASLMCIGSGSHCLSSSGPSASRWTLATILSGAAQGRDRSDALAHLVTHARLALSTGASCFAFCTCFRNEIGLHPWGQVALHWISARSLQAASSKHPF